MSLLLAGNGCRSGRHAVDHIPSVFSAFFLCRLSCDDLAVGILCSQHADHLLPELFAFCAHLVAQSTVALVCGISDGIRQAAPVILTTLLHTAEPGSIGILGEGVDLAYDLIPCVILLHFSCSVLAATFQDLHIQLPVIVAAKHNHLLGLPGIVLLFLDRYPNAVRTVGIP